MIVGGMRRRVLVLALLAVGCGRHVDLCETGDATVLVDDRAVSGYGIAADAQGWLVVWSEAPAGTSTTTIRAARPGGAPIDVATVEGFGPVAAAAAGGGTLACWSGTCAVLDEGLRPGPTHDSGMMIGALARVDGQLVGIDSARSVVTLDESGSPSSTPVELPCDRLGWGDRALVCLTKSDPLCVTQHADPPDCMYLMQLLGPDLAPVSEPLAVVPTGSYPDGYRVHIAGDAGGLLIGWVGSDSALNLQPITPEGALGAAATMGLPGLHFDVTLSPAGGDYAVTWDIGEWPDLTHEYALLDSGGAVVVGPASFGAGPPGSDTPTIVASNGSAWALAWVDDYTESGQSDTHMRLSFRAMGCGASR